jgi:hypothetical protein
LSCERGVAAKLACTNCDGSWEKLCGLDPAIQDCHLRLLKKDTFNLLFNSSSHRTKGTLYYIKKMFGLRDLKKDVSLFLNTTVDFLNFATEAHVCAISNEYMEQRNINPDLLNLAEKKQAS